MKIINSLFILLVFCNFVVFAQKTKVEITGSISGTILDENNSPIENAEVVLESLNRRKSPVLVEVSDRKGRFEFKKIIPTTYRIKVRFAGYILPDAMYKKTYQINEDILFPLQKGGIITGKISDSDGSPLIRVPVQIIRIRDEFGNRIKAGNGNASAIINYATSQNYTDDRGVYRVFGINAGSYLVYVGGQESSEIKSLISSDSVSVYHPSDTIDTAAEVDVNFGQVTDFVNIQFRETNGFRISGAINFVESAKSKMPRFYLDLIHKDTIQTVARIEVRSNKGRYSFKLEQIPQGEYELRVTQWNGSQNTHKGYLKEVFVTDRDLTGLRINMRPLAAISGKVILEKSPNLEQVKECENVENNILTKTTFRILPLKSDQASLAENFIAPDEKGEFKNEGLESRRYFLTTKLPSKNLYIKDIYQVLTSKEKRNLSESGINLQGVKKLENLRIVLGNGAGSVSGKVKISASETDEITSLFFKIYLIPKDKDKQNNILYYAETISEEDGIYSFSNVATGNYFLYAEAFKFDADEIQTVKIPEFWDKKKRTELLKNAEANEDSITVKSCENLTAQNLNF